MNKTKYTTFTNNLNPYFVTGFCDGEATFTVSVMKDRKSNTGWYVLTRFSICLHKKDLNLLKQLQSHFGGVGSIFIKETEEAVYFTVAAAGDLTNKIIPFLSKFPLITQKQADFLLFSQIIDLINKKEHLTMEGLQKVINIKASMNKGISEDLKEAFPNTKPVARPLVEFKGIPDPNWLVGFVSGEGCFYVKITKGQTKTGYAVSLNSYITQHSRDQQLIASIADYLGCGTTQKDSKNLAVYFLVSKFSDTWTKIIPFFNQYPIQGSKRLDYLDFCKVAQLIKDKAHLTSEGLDKIRGIKAGMNRGRYNA